MWFTDRSNSALILTAFWSISRQTAARVSLQQQHFCLLAQLVLWVFAFLGSNWWADKSGRQHECYLDKSCNGLQNAVKWLEAIRGSGIRGRRIHQKPTRPAKTKLRIHSNPDEEKCILCTSFWVWERTKFQKEHVHQRYLRLTIQSTCSTENGQHNMNIPTHPPASINTTLRPVSPSSCFLAGCSSTWSSQGSDKPAPGLPSGPSTTMHRTHHVHIIHWCVAAWHVGRN